MKKLLLFPIILGLCYVAAYADTTALKSYIGREDIKWCTPGESTTFTRRTSAGGSITMTCVDTGEGGDGNNTGVVSNEAYGTTWDGNNTVGASKNALYDKISVMVADTAYSSAWNGNTTVAPSKNATYDKINAMISDVTYGASWDGNTTVSPSKNAVYDKFNSLTAAMISDQAYNDDWNGNSTVAPSKNATYDALTGMAGLSVEAYGAVPDDNTTPVQTANVVAFQTVLDLQGNVVLAPNKAYYLNGKIKLKSHTWLHGGGKTRLIFSNAGAGIDTYSSSTSGHLYETRVERIKISDLNIENIQDWNGTIVTGNHAIMLGKNEAAQNAMESGATEIQNVSFSGWGDSAIKVDCYAYSVDIYNNYFDKNYRQVEVSGCDGSNSPTGIGIHANTFNQCGNDTIYIHGFGEYPAYYVPDRVQIYGNRGIASSGEVKGYWVNASYADGLVMFGNRFEGRRTDLGVPFSIYANTIKGAKLDLSTGENIYLTGNSRFNDITFSKPLNGWSIDTNGVYEDTANRTGDNRIRIVDATDWNLSSGHGVIWSYGSSDGNVTSDIQVINYEAGNLSLTPTVLTTSTTLTKAGTYEVNDTSGNVVITLPASYTQPFNTITVKKVGGGNLTTVKANTYDLIDSSTQYILSTIGSYITLKPRNTYYAASTYISYLTQNWSIVGAGSGSSGSVPTQSVWISTVADSIYNNDEAGFPNVLIVDTSQSSSTHQLRPARGVEGQSYTFIKEDNSTNTITIYAYDYALQKDWQASTEYALTDCVVATVHDGFRYCAYSVSGDAKTGAAEPTWETLGGNDTVDGNVTWIAYASNPGDYSNPTSSYTLTKQGDWITFFAGHDGAYHVSDGILSQNGYKLVEGPASPTAGYLTKWDATGQHIVDGPSATVPSFTSETIAGTTGGYKRLFSEATATLTGASTAIQVNIPATSRILGCQLRVDTLIESAAATSWDVEFSGGSALPIASGQPFAQNTKVNSLASDIVLSETDLLVTPNTGTFTAGVVRAVCYFETFVQMGDAS